MLLNPITNRNRSASDTSQLRALVNLADLCDAQSESIIASHPFRLYGREGTWTGALLPNGMGALAVESDLGGQPLSPGSHLGSDLSWSLHQAGIYARETDNLRAWKSALCELKERGKPLRCGDWRYEAAPILKMLRALGAPDLYFARGHFTGQEPIGGVPNPQLLALSGAVAGARWRVFVLPTIAKSQPTAGGAK